MEIITWQDIILETLPLRQEILDWCQLHPEFQHGLKALVSERFLHLGAIIITHPQGTYDEVIGVYAYDYRGKPPLFKQDFIVDVGMAHKEFILYTGFLKGTQNTKYVKHINEFFLKYGQNGNYTGSHHLTFDQLPNDPEIRGRATSVIERAKNLPDDITNPPQQMMADYLTKIRETKRNNPVEFRRLK